jgi:hypothetical protein
MATRRGPWLRGRSLGWISRNVALGADPTLSGTDAQGRPERAIAGESAPRVESCGRT